MDYHKRPFFGERIKNMRKLQILGLIIIIFQFCSIVNGQATSTKYEVSSSEDAHCEQNNRYIEQFVDEATKEIKKNERIFIISYVGKNEKVNINHSRLNYALAILTQLKGIEAKRIITATAQKNSEEKGKLEFYLGSELFLVSKAATNKQICLLCCESPYR